LTGRRTSGPSEGNRLRDGQALILRGRGQKSKRVSQGESMSKLGGNEHSESYCTDSVEVAHNPNLSSKTVLPLERRPAGLGGLGRLWKDRPDQPKKKVVCFA